VGQIASDLAAAVSSLCRDENYRQQLAWGALRRSADYSWQKKMDTLDEVYSLAFANRVDDIALRRPDNGLRSGFTLSTDSFDMAQRSRD